MKSVESGGDPIVPSLKTYASGVIWSDQLALPSQDRDRW